MRINEVKRKLARGEVVYGVGVAAGSPLVAETLGHSGFDWILIDLQHGETGIQRVGEMLTALSSTPAVPWVRVPTLDPVAIERVLDFGAYGVVVPSVRSAAEAAEAVSAARYPPRGHRSWGPTRGILYGGSDYFTASADELQVLVQIESVAGVQAVEAIAAVDGVDGCLIGTNDLSLAYGQPPRPVPDRSHLAPVAEDAVRRVIAACRLAGKSAGIFTTDPQMARHRVEQGCRIIWLLGDVGSLRLSCSTALATARDSVSSLKASAT